MTKERIEQIRESTLFPKSVSVQRALLQVWNECGQELTAEREKAAKLVELLEQIDKSLYLGGDLNDIDILKWYIDVTCVIKDQIKQSLTEYKKQ